MENVSGEVTDSTPDSCQCARLRHVFLPASKWSFLFVGMSRAALALEHDTRGVACLSRVRSSSAESHGRLEALAKPSEPRTKRRRSKVKESSSFGNLCPPAKYLTPAPAPKSAAFLPTMCWMARVSAFPTRWILDDALITPTSP